MTVERSAFAKSQGDNHGNDFLLLFADFMSCTSWRDTWVGLNHFLLFDRPTRRADTNRGATLVFIFTSHSSDCAKNIISESHLNFLRHSSTVLALVTVHINRHRSRIIRRQALFWCQVGWRCCGRSEKGARRNTHTHLRTRSLTGRGGTQCQETLGLTKQQSKSALSEAGDCLGPHYIVQDASLSVCFSRNGGVKKERKQSSGGGGGGFDEEEEKQQGWKTVGRKKFKYTKRRIHFATSAVFNLSDYWGVREREGGECLEQRTSALRCVC